MPTTASKCIFAPRAAKACAFPRRTCASSSTKTKPSGRKAPTNTKPRKFPKWPGAPASVATPGGSTRNGPSLKTSSSPNDRECRFPENQTGCKRRQNCQSASHVHGLTTAIFAPFELERCEAPDEARGPNFLRGEGRSPNGENLRPLVNALETFFGFGDGFDRCDPELFGQRRVQSHANALPAVFHAQDGRGQSAASSKLPPARRIFASAALCPRPSCAWKTAGSAFAWQSAAEA